MPNSGRSWLGTRLPWIPVRTPSGTGRAAVVTIKNNRVPWLRSQKYAIAVICHNDFSLCLYAADKVEPNALIETRPFWLANNDTATLEAIDEVVNWPGAEGCYSAYHGKDIADDFPSHLFTQQFIARWTAASVPDWWIIERGGTLGVSYICQLVDRRDCVRRVVELTTKELIVYRGDMLQCSSLSDRDSIARIRISQLSVPRLSQLFDTPHIVSVRQVARKCRYWLYQCALAYDMPF